MQKLLMFFASLLITCVVSANSSINIYYTVGVGPSFSLIPSTIAALEHANATQSKYKFTIEFKPGANGLLAVKSLDKDPVNRIVGVGPHFLRHVENNSIAIDDYVPVESTGFDMCTGVITNVGDTKLGIDSLEAFRGKTITIGTLSPASPAYTTAVELSKRYGFIPKFVAFDSDDAGFQALVSNHGINFAFNSPKKYLQYLPENSNLNLLAMHCPKRLESMPHVKTLTEQNIHVPIIFNMLLAKSNMPAHQRKEIGKIIADSQDAVGLWTTRPHLSKPTSPNWHYTRLYEQQSFMTKSKVVVNGKL
jgi:tripartite-type tricarboxylate transporter receptor subunit TctC